MNITLIKYWVALSVSILASYILLETSWAENRVYAVKTNSLTCDFCAYDLEEKFLKMKNVTEFDVDIDGILFIKTNMALQLETAFVKKILLDNGFDFNGMTESIE